MQRLRQEQRAGRVIDIENLDWFLFEGLVIWMEIEAAYQRRHEAHLSLLIAKMVGQ